MHTNYVLIDYENVQPKNLSLLSADHFRVVLFVGQSQHSVRTDIAIAMQSFGKRAGYVRIAGNGSNALDFHIAYYIGRFVARDSTAFFHIISNDTGFDPLIMHLRKSNIEARRWAQLEQIPILRTVAPVAVAVPTHMPTPPPGTSSPAGPAAPTTDTDPTHRVIGHLKKMSKHPPSTEKALRASIGSWLRNMDERCRERVLAELRQRRVIAIEGTRVRYTLDA